MSDLFPGCASFGMEAGLRAEIKGVLCRFTSSRKGNTFRDFRTVWNAPHHAKLRAKRKNPHVLLPGDELFIPEKEIRTENRPTAKLHAFQIPSGKLKLQVLIQNVDGDPIDDTTVSLLAGGEASRVKTQQGIVEKEIPRNAH